MGTHCNSRKCGAPAPAQPQQGNHFVGGRASLASPYGAAPVVYQRAIPGLVPVVPSAPSGQREQKPPPGSWVCTACNNVNWPNRETCNAKNCGQPRALVDGGE